MLKANKYFFMASRVARFFLIGFFLFSVAGIFLPLSAQAALVPCGTSANPEPCTVCHIAVMGNNIITYALRIMTYVGIAVIVAMGILYIVSTGDEGMMKTAKGGIVAALVGFAILLGAWLMVNTTLRILSVESIEGLTISSRGFGFTCDTASSVNSP